MPLGKLDSDLLLLASFLLVFSFYYTLSKFREDDNERALDRKISFSFLLLTFVYLIIVIVCKYLY